MTTPNDRPLWRVMDDSYDRDTPYRLCYAYMIRAIADHVVPEESEPGMPDFPDANDAAPWQRWHRDQTLRALLLAEADRAEAGQ